MNWFPPQPRHFAVVAVLDNDRSGIVFEKEIYMKDCTYQVDVVGEPGADGKRFRAGYKTWHENLDAEGSKDIGESANNTLAAFQGRQSPAGELTAKLDATIDGAVQQQQSFKITRDALDEIEDLLLAGLSVLHQKSKKHHKDKKAKHK